MKLTQSTVLASLIATACAGMNWQFRVGQNYEPIPIPKPSKNGVAKAKRKKRGKR